MASERQSIPVRRNSKNDLQSLGSIAGLLFFALDFPELMKRVSMHVLEQLTGRRQLPLGSIALFFILMLMLSSADRSAAQCRAQFTFHYTETDSTMITFVDSSAGTNTKSSWDFGDGTVINSKNQVLTHRYLKNGTYLVCHFVEDSTKFCSDSSCYTVIVKDANQPCKANFNFTAQDTQVTFKNTSTNAASALWIFGDGVISTEKSPLHLYRSIGQTQTFNVCLIITDYTEKCVDTICKPVTITPNIDCEAKFTTKINFLEVNFISSSVDATDYFWEFGDGDTSHNPNPKHTFKQAENYKVCLTVYNSTNGCSDSTCSTITVSNQKCKAAYRLGIDTSEKFKLYLLNTSTNASSHQYLWDFGDGAESLDRNPSHQYSTYGRYTVCLSIKDTILNCEDTYCDSLGMDKDGRLLKAGFTLQVIEDNWSSAAKMEQQKLNIYPNPVIDYLYLSLADNHNAADIQVINLKGEVLLQKEIQYEKDIKLDVSFLMDGFYILMVNDGQNVYRNRFVKRN